MLRDNMVFCAHAGEAMTRPVRLQLSRARGFNLQERSRAVNGLPAVNCARPTKLGNPYRVGIHGTAEECVRKFEADWHTALSHVLGCVLVQNTLDKLRGKNLACWCELDEPCCHADVLLELANK
jgi:hypothetical protein